MFFICHIMLLWLEKNGIKSNLVSFVAGMIMWVVCEWWACIMLTFICHVLWLSWLSLRWLNLLGWILTCSAQSLLYFTSSRALRMRRDEYAVFIYNSHDSGSLIRISSIFGSFTEGKLQLIDERIGINILSSCVTPSDLPYLIGQRFTCSSFSCCRRCTFD